MGALTARDLALLDIYLEQCLEYKGPIVCAMGLGAETITSIVEGLVGEDGG